MGADGPGADARRGTASHIEIQVISKTTAYITGKIVQVFAGRILEAQISLRISLEPQPRAYG